MENKTKRGYKNSHFPAEKSDLDDEYDRKWTKRALKAETTDDIVRVYAGKTPDYDNSLAAATGGDKEKDKKDNVNKVNTTRLEISDVKQELEFEGKKVVCARISFVFNQRLK